MGVLLKNDPCHSDGWEGPALPLDLTKCRKVAVLGPNAADTVVQGGGSSRVNPKRCQTILEALKAALEPAGVTVIHQTGCYWGEELPAELMTAEINGLKSLATRDKCG